MQSFARAAARRLAIPRHVPVTTRGFAACAVRSMKTEVNVEGLRGETSTTVPVEAMMSPKAGMPTHTCPSDCGKEGRNADLGSAMKGY